MPKNQFTFYDNTQKGHYSFGYNMKTNTTRYKYANKVKFSFDPDAGKTFSLHTPNAWWKYRNPKGITGAPTFPAAKKTGVSGLDPKATKPYKKKLPKSEEDELVALLGGVNLKELEDLSQQLEDTAPQEE